jgi:serpin B
MKQILFAILALSLSVPALPCGAQSLERRSPRSATAAEQTLSQADNEFGFTLFHSLNNSEPENNLLISPFSVAAALTMTHNGAASETKTVMENTLHLAGLEIDDINRTYKSLLAFLQELDPEVQMEIANSIWYEQSLLVKNDFRDTNTEYYDAEVRALDFAKAVSVEHINNWVDLKTHGKIRTIIDKIDPLQLMFIINAVYFKATWTHPFPENLTKAEPFFRKDGTDVPCQLMSQTGNFAYCDDDTLQAITLPLGNALFGMSIIFPAKNVDIDALISALEQNTWSGITDHLSPAYGNIFFPRFEFQYKAELKEALSKLGMSDCFDVRADFSNISDTPLFIENVIHKTYIKTDEKGTEAAAVTAAVMLGSSVHPDPKPEFTMRVDRPFLFVIHERMSGAILFLGKVLDPTAG